MIDRFIGNYSFLSNFFLCRIMFEGEKYPSVENAFQAAKTLNRHSRKQFQSLGCTPAMAKKLGRKLALRPDWKTIRDYIMYEIILDKFLRNNDLCISLMNTGKKQLIEGNTWGDKYWGVVDGIGENKLGKILMHLRATMQEISDVA